MRLNDSVVCPFEPANRGTESNRKRHSGKTMLADEGTFEPVIVPKDEHRLDGFDDRIRSLYARSIKVREIQPTPSDPVTASSRHQTT